MPPGGGPGHPRRNRRARIACSPAKPPFRRRSSPADAEGQKTGVMFAAFRRAAAAQARLQPDEPDDAADAAGPISGTQRATADQGRLPDRKSRGRRQARRAPPVVSRARLATIYVVFLPAEPPQQQPDAADAAGGDDAGGPQRRPRCGGSSGLSIFMAGWVPTDVANAGGDGSHWCGGRG